MKDIPSDHKYTKTHEWVTRDSDGNITIGITEHAQELLGDIVFVQLPEVGEEITQGSEAGVIESVKAAADFYAPISGEVLSINADLANSPGLINEEPYGNGWLIKIKPADDAQWDELLSMEDYQTITEEDN